MLISCAGTAGAADWSFDPRITLDLLYNDNNELTGIPGEEIKVSGSALDAQLTLRGETPRSSFRLIPRLRSTFYPGDEQEETDNQFLRLELEHRGERSKAAIDAAYSRVTMLGGYFPVSTVAVDDDLGAPGRGEGVGKSTGQNHEERVEVLPAAAFKLTERVGLDLRMEYLDVNYDQQIDNDLENFSNLIASAGLSFRLSPTAAVSVTAGAARYEPEGDSSTDVQALHAEWSNRISETSAIYVRGGASRVKDDSTGGSGWSTGFSGGAGVRWSFEVTEIFVDANHYLDPSTAGQIVVRDQLRFQLSRRVGPLTTVYLSARGIQDDQGARSDGTFVSREYAAGSVGFAWRMTRQFTLGGGYEYSWRKYENETHDAASNALHLGITYEPRLR
jgi:hypothetical protein